MQHRRMLRLAWVVCALVPMAVLAAGPRSPGQVGRTGFLGWGRKKEVPPQETGLPVMGALNLDAVAEPYREKVESVLAKSSLHISGPSESFYCHPPLYHWLLDHPDRAVKAWRKLGAECAAIEDRGNGRFGWRDGQGSDVAWDVVVRDETQQTWYAEGVFNPGTLMPTVKLRAVVILHLSEMRDAKGRPAMRHRGELFLQTDSRAVNLAARLLGASAPRMAEQYVAQIQMFFAALAHHMDRHPEHIDWLNTD